MHGLIRLCALLRIATQQEETLASEKDNLSHVHITGEESAGSIREVTHFSDTAMVSHDIIQGGGASKSRYRVFRTETLEEFIQRPFPIFQGVWRAADPVGSIIASAMFPNDLLAVDSIWDKLKNYQYLRAGVRVGLRVNGTKFHYGKLLCAWQPFQDIRDNPLVYMNVWSASANPHVIVSASEAEVNELTIPFVHPHDFWDLDDIATISSRDFYSLGRLNVYVLNPLAQGAAVPDVNISMFANFVDPMVQGMTMHGHTQPSVAAMPATASAEVYNMEYESYANKQILYHRTRRRGPVPEELIAQGLESQGVSEPSMGRRIVDSAVSVVDTIGTYLGKAMTFASLLSQFGLSIAPLLDRAKSNVGMAYSSFIPVLHNFAHSVGQDYAIKLGLVQDNKVAPCYDVIGSSPEETTFDYLFSIPSLIAIVDWTAASAINTQLYSVPLAPFFLQHTAPSTHGTAVYQSMLAFATVPFTYWRGSIRFCVQVTCSGFHSGRLRLVYEPNEHRIYNSPSRDSHNCANYILDITSESETHLSIPYMSEKPFRSAGETIGTFSIEVLNPLAHPESPVPKAYINLWVSGGPDFQVAGPNNEGCYHTIANEGWTSQGLYEEVELVAQGLSREQMRTAEYPPILPSVTVPETDCVMGEHARNVRDLTGRYCLWKNNFPLRTDRWQGICPYAYCNSTVHSHNDYRMTFLEWYQLVYATQRGSLNMKIVPFDDDSIPSGVSNDINSGRFIVSIGHWSVSNGQLNKGGDTYAHGFSEVLGDGGSAIPYSHGAMMVSKPTSQAISVSVPYYTNLRFIPTMWSGNKCDDYTFVPKFEILSQDSTDTAGTNGPSAELFMASGDDYTLGYVIGPPLVYR